MAVLLAGNTWPCGFSLLHRLFLFGFDFVFEEIPDFPPAPRRLASRSRREAFLFLPKGRLPKKETESVMISRALDSVFPPLIHI
jgi:hypothetical protein